MIVQILLMRLLGTMPQQAAVASVEEMEALMEAALAKPPADHDTQKMQQMMKFRAEEFFQRMRQGMGFPPRKTGASAPAN